MLHVPVSPVAFPLVLERLLRPEGEAQGEGSVIVIMENKDCILQVGHSTNISGDIDSNIGTVCVLSPVAHSRMTESLKV